MDHIIRKKESLFEALSEDIRELKSRSKSYQPIILNYMCHESISKDSSDNTMYFGTKKETENVKHKPSKSYPTVSDQSKIAKSSKIKSVSAPSIKTIDTVKNLTKSSKDSELSSQLSISTSGFLSDPEILNKNVSFQKTAATNYSIKDCSEYNI